MKKMNARMLSWLLAVCLVFTMTVQISGVQVLAAEETVQSTGFEAGNSFLTQAQYAALGFPLGSAASHDEAPAQHPLEGLGDAAVTYNGVEYGWSNPQVITVMLSSPYWNELDYGVDMAAAGKTSFSVSTGVEASDSVEGNVGLKASITAQTSQEIAGNGFELGCSFSAAMECAVGVQRSKATVNTLTFEAGAGEDHVALIVFPVAVYEYEVTVSGATQYIYVNLQLTPVSSVVTLDAYNAVVREYNMTQSSDDMKLTQIDMDAIRPGYTAGDPSTYFSSTEQLPTGFTVQYGKLVPTTVGDTLASDQIAGSAVVTNSPQTVTLGNADTDKETSLTVETSTGVSGSLKVILGAGVFGGIKVGFDGFGVESETSVKAEVSVETGLSVSTAVVNTGSITYSMSFADLPQSAATGQTSAGVATSEYSFQAAMFVWSPTQRGDGMDVAPRIVGAVVTFPDASSMPLYLPDDLHVSAVGEDSVTLSWTNADFTAAPFDQRIPTEYVVYMSSSGSEALFAQKSVVSADSQSVTISGLASGESYSFALGARDDDQTSPMGPAVEVTTSIPGHPVITGQPQSITVREGEQALLTVTAAADSGGTLSYQWYRLEKGRYGTSWSQLSGQTGATFNAAYYAEDGLVDAANRYDLDGTVYRCIVLEDQGSQIVNVASNAVTVTVADDFYSIGSYGELVELAEAVSSGTAAYEYDFILTNDITVPEGAQWLLPIGTSSIPFTGTFDGRGHTISGLNGDVGSVSCFGLFGVLNGATVKDLHLENAAISADDAYVGGICGKAQNSVISGCTVSGAVTLSDPEGFYAAGGVCGYAGSGTVIEKCINYSTVWMQSDAAGGVCGRNEGTVMNCANLGSLDIHCPYLDHMPTSAYGGGIVGRNYGSVRNCYHTGTLTTSNATYGETTPLCHNNGAVDSYYLNSITNADGGRTSAQFASGEVTWLLNGGVTDGTQAWYQNIDNGEAADAYPTLSSNGKDTVYQVYQSDRSFSNFEDELDKLLEKDDQGRYVIESFEDLMDMAEMVNSGVDKFVSGSYVIVADLVCNTAVWQGIGTDTVRFQGTLDGQGHTLSELNRHDQASSMYGSLVGLFTALAEGAVVEDIIISRAYIYDSNGAGAIARENNGTIRRCLVVGSSMINVTGSGALGGIAGVNNGTIEDCGVVGLGLVRRTDIDGSYPMGGISQINNGAVRDCYSYELLPNILDGNAGPLICTGNAPENSYHYSLDELIITAYGTQLEKSAFDSGEVAWLLNGDQSQIIWKQTIGSMDYPTFTGETVYQVADCLGQSVYSNTNEDIGHQLGDDDICDLCGYDSVPAVITPLYPSLSFEDEIMYNLYFTVQGMDVAAEDMGLLIWSSQVEDGTIEDAEQILSGAVTDGDRYMVHTGGVPAKNMGDAMYFKIYARLTDGSYVYSDMVGYNARLYADTVLNGEYTDEMKSLVVAMVNYGAQAQLYFGHNTGNLVNAALTEEQKALVSSYDESMVDAVVSADSSKTANFVRVNSNFSSLYPSVSFDGAFSINFYCTPAITVDDGMTLYYWDAEAYNSITEFTVDNATGSMEMTVSGSGHYWGNVPGIAAKEIDETYYVACVFESGGETVTTGIIAYSLGSYCEGKAATDGDAQQNFAQATAVYGYYAKQYFASIA